jgi:hypothetical protein
MCKPLTSCAIGLIFLTCLGSAAIAADAAPQAPQTQPAAPSKVIAVTVYQGTALVTRQVEVPDGAGLQEVIVAPLPPQTIEGSLYTEGIDGIRVLSTRYRTRAVKEDTREEVRTKQDQIRLLQQANEQLARQAQVMTDNLAFITKLENFTTVTMQQMTDKGLLNAESTLKIADFIMTTRTAKSQAIVTLQQQQQANTDAIAFAQRQLSELAVGANRTEREAVIVVDKAAAVRGTIKLNYLVNSASWKPVYKVRADGEKDPIQLEYLAAIEQQCGEDWNGVDLVLSTAQPLLNAVPPELSELDIAVTQDANAGNQSLSKSQIYSNARGLRQQAGQAQFGGGGGAGGGGVGFYLNGAAAAEQWVDLLSKDSAASDGGQDIEGPSVAYHLNTKLTLPSRNDQQLVEVARIDIAGQYFYKTVPVLAPHVYRLATLVNQSKYVLLPGEATMYLGSDFVGRMNLPLVAIGEQFVVGLGVDPQFQVERKLVSKAQTIQGGNQVQTYDYRIRISSFKDAPVQLQVWDRLPQGEAETVSVELLKSSSELSADPSYLRSDRPHNLLRWDLTVKPGTSGENAEAISYQFRLQYDRNVKIGSFTAK